MGLGTSFGENYRNGESPWHRANPIAKVSLVIAFVLVASLLPDGRWIALGLLAVVLWIAAAKAGIGAVWLLRRSLLALPFLLAALPLPFTYPGTIVARLPLLEWSVSYEGVVRLVTIVAKSWLSVQAALFLTATTSFPAILWGLRGLHVPRVMVAIIALMYRYIYVLGEEIQRLLRARTARSALLPGKRRPGLLWQAGVAGNMVGLLFVRSLERSERVYAAMLARGYAGEVRLLAPPAWQEQDTVLMAVSGIVLALVLATGMVG